MQNINTESLKNAILVRMSAWDAQDLKEKRLRLGTMTAAEHLAQALSEVVMYAKQIADANLNINNNAVWPLLDKLAVSIEKAFMYESLLHPPKTVSDDEPF